MKKSIVGVIALCLCVVGIAAATVAVSVNAGREVSNDPGVKETVSDQAFTQPTFQRSQNNPQNKAPAKLDWSMDKARTSIETFLHYKSLYDASLREVVFALELSSAKRLESIKSMCADMDVSVREYSREMNKLVSTDPDFFAKHMMEYKEDFTELPTLIEKREARPLVPYTVRDIRQEDAEEGFLAYRVTLEHGGETVSSLFTFHLFEGHYDLYDWEKA